MFRVCVYVFGPCVAVRARHRACVQRGLCVVACGCVLFRVVVYGRVWLCVVLRGCVWLCTVVCGCVIVCVPCVRVCGACVAVCVRAPSRVCAVWFVCEVYVDVHLRLCGDV